MTFDQLAGKVVAEIGDGMRATTVNAVATTLKHLGFVIDEATGEIEMRIPTPQPWTPPRQQNVRHSGQVGRKRRK